jgi:dihydroorotate dehydrogenase electron transfer subunit
MIWVPGIDEVPMSISNTTKDEVWITVKKVGEATTAIHKVAEGELLGLRGPYGTRFSAKGRNILVVGGGIGAAPLLFLTKKLTDADKRITVVVGARSADKLLLQEDFGKLSKHKRSRLILTTDDGSAGTRGFAGDVAAALLEKEEFDRVYTCGPEPMIHKIIITAQSKRVQVEASLERYMRCGIGICGSCYIGRYLVCKDGPVFTGARLEEIVQYLKAK